MAVFSDNDAQSVGVSKSFLIRLLNQTISSLLDQSYKRDPWIDLKSIREILGSGSVEVDSDADLMMYPASTNLVKEQRDRVSITAIPALRGIYQCLRDPWIVQGSEVKAGHMTALFVGGHDGITC